MKVLCLFALLLVTTTVHAQQDCGGMANAGGQCVPPDVAMPEDQQQAPQLPAQKWVDHYGAIATDFSHGSVGIANDLQDQHAAEQAAISACQARGGVTCNVEITYRNQCAGLVAGDSGHNTKAGSTVADAMQKAMKTCEAADTNCRAFYNYSGCSLPMRIQ